MRDAENGKQAADTRLLPSCNQHEEFVVTGRMVTVRPKNGHPSAVSTSSEESVSSAGKLPGRNKKLMGFPVTRTGRAPEKRTDLLAAPEVLTLEELAKRAIDGLDYNGVMDQLADLGPEGRVLLFFREGKLARAEVFEDPRICKDLQRGAVIHNLEQIPVDVSGWRVHEFYIDSKGCLGEVCTRCMRVCPEDAIHLKGDGASSYCEIDPTACKGCFICWVECSRKAADCIQVDGKTFDSELRAHHFGE